jgi:hypothetical protein
MMGSIFLHGQASKLFKKRVLKMSQCVVEAFASSFFLSMGTFDTYWVRTFSDCIET